MYAQTSLCIILSVVFFLVKDALFNILFPRKPCYFRLCINRYTFYSMTELFCDFVLLKSQVFC